MASSHSRVLSGFNQNFRYKGKTYHIQTEDSGRGNATIVTHVYLGGVILFTLPRACTDTAPPPAARGSWSRFSRRRGGPTPGMSSWGGIPYDGEARDLTCAFTPFRAW